MHAIGARPRLRSRVFGLSNAGYVSSIWGQAEAIGGGAMPMGGVGAIVDGMASSCHVTPYLTPHIPHIYRCGRDRRRHGACSWDASRTHGRRRTAHGSFPSSSPALLPVQVLSFSEAKGGGFFFWTADKRFMVSRHASRHALLSTTASSCLVTPDLTPHIPHIYR